MECGGAVEGIGGLGAGGGVGWEANGKSIHQPQPPPQKK